MKDYENGYVKEIECKHCGAILTYFCAEYIVREEQSVCPKCNRVIYEFDQYDWCILISQE